MGIALLTAAAMLLISVAGGRPRVVVANEQAVSYGLARMFELMTGAMGGQFHVVRSVDELKTGGCLKTSPTLHWRRKRRHDPQDRRLRPPLRSARLRSGSAASCSLGPDKPRNEV